VVAYAAAAYPGIGISFQISFN